MNRPHRPQAHAVTVDDDDLRPLNVKPLTQTDRLHNPDDIEVDEAAIANGVEHGGTTETSTEVETARGEGARRPAQNSLHARGRSGRGTSKKH